MSQSEKRKLVSDLQHRILKHVNSENYQPVKPKVIAKKLGVPTDGMQLVRMAVKLLAKEGLVSYGSKHLVHPTKPSNSKPSSSKSSDSKSSDPKSKHLMGKFHRTAKGFGFVRPTGTIRAQGRDADIFIAESDTIDAATGDKVNIRLNREGRGSHKHSGEIVEIVERSRTQFVGSYVLDDGQSFVQVDGKLFVKPVPVGDPGAKDVQIGDKVVVDMIQFPSDKTAGEAVITERLGKAGEANVDTLMIMREFSLPGPFPEDVLDVARDQAEKFAPETIGDRLDLTEATILTIDPKDARDFDDAVSLEKLENGHWRLGVHIADVSHFVPEGSSLDDEARDRATSIYLPDRVIPMLPEIISNGLASLQPKKHRYAKTVFIEMTEEGVRVATDFANSVIVSKHRFTYEEVDDYLADPKPWRTKIPDSICGLVDRMHTLAMTLRTRRLDRGAIELILPETKIDFDKNGRVSGAHKVLNTVSHQIIEEFMLSANEAVAERLTDEEINFLRRVHEPPEPRRLKQLTTFVHDLGIECESLESRFEIKRVIKEVEGAGESHAVNFAVLKSMSKAHYSPVDEGHYALNSPNYCHFTSPIRRYPDLVVHRIVGALASSLPPDDEIQKLLQIGEHCSQREQRAEAAERELVKLKLLGYLQNRVGQKMEAIVTGVESFGLFAQGVEIPAEGLIHIDAMTDDYYVYDDATHSLTGRRNENRYRLGDTIEVEVAAVDMERRELNLSLIRKVDNAVRRAGKDIERDKKGGKSGNHRGKGKEFKLASGRQAGQSKKESWAAPPKKKKNVRKKKK
ncbi:MAG: ribonuclease R [Pirellulaceae bacterium]|jgi:ribonuclease R